MHGIAFRCSDRKTTGSAQVYHRDNYVYYFDLENYHLTVYDMDLITNTRWVRWDKESAKNKTVPYSIISAIKKQSQIKALFFVQTKAYEYFSAIFCMSLIFCSMSLTSLNCVRQRIRLWSSRCILK